MQSQYESAPPPLTALHFSDGETKVREMKNFPHATYSVQQSQVSNPDPQTLDAFWVQHIVCPGGGPAPGSTGGQQLRRGGGCPKPQMTGGEQGPLCVWLVHSSQHLNKVLLRGTH